MINNIGTIAIYVKSQEASQEFWTKKVGFITIREDQMSPHQFWIEVAPNEKSQTRLIIYSIDMMLEQDSETICHPSVVFECTRIDEVHNQMKKNQVEVGPIQSMIDARFFEMKDNEGNSFLIRENVLL